MATLTSDWGRMSYADSGARGVALVFLHGSGCDSADWERVIRLLPAEARVVTMDFRGHGKSSVPDRPFTLRDLADDVGELAARRRLERMVLVGHSLGGMVAIEVAARDPRVAALVLLEGWTRLGCGRAFGGPRFYGGLDTHAIQRIQRKSEATRARVPEHLWRHFWQSVEAFDGAPLFSRIQVPVYEVYGEQGRTDATARGLLIPEGPAVNLVWIAGAGHYLPQEKPDDVARVCVAALPAASTA